MAHDLDSSCGLENLKKPNSSFQAADKYLIINLKSQQIHLVMTSFRAEGKYHSLKISTISTYTILNNKTERNTQL